MIGELLREPDISMAAQLTNQPENELTIKKKKKKNYTRLAGNVILVFSLSKKDERCKCKYCMFLQPSYLQPTSYYCIDNRYSRCFLY